MWILVGLGNPGKKYRETRHNIGFLIIDQFAEKHRIPLQNTFLFEKGKALINDTTIILIKPTTYMNRSGLAVKEILKKYSSDHTNLVVIHDDLDMETGKLKIKKQGSSGGHNGVQSIIDSVGATNFIRVKAGIGRDFSMDSADYVLRKFSKNEKVIIDSAIIDAVDALESILYEGVDKAMNRFN